MEIKVIALDVYGTILATEDHENSLRPRKGFFELVGICKRRGVALVTSSDNTVDLTKIDLMTSKVPLEIFDGFYPMKPGVPKDFSGIIKHYKIKPEELLVIGDKPYIDIALAKEIGCHTALVPEYVGYGDKFDLMSIPNLPTSPD